MNTGLETSMARMNTIVMDRGAAGAHALLQILLSELLSELLHIIHILLH